IRPRASMIHGEHVEHNSARPRVRFSHIAMADTLRTYPLEIEIVGFQPAAEISETSGLSANVHNQVDINSRSRWIGTVLRCKQPHHLAAYQAPGRWKDPGEVEENEPALLLGRWHGPRERDRCHSPHPFNSQRR